MIKSLFKDSLISNSWFETQKDVFMKLSLKFKKLYKAELYKQQIFIYQYQPLNQKLLWKNLVNADYWDLEVHKSLVKYKEDITILYY